MKECRKCLEFKPFKAFYTDGTGRRKDGLYPWCKPCKTGYLRGRYIERSRNYDLTVRIKRRYGLTWAEATAKYGTACNICGRDRAGNGKDFRLSVDHDHKAGVVRGVLCSPCNRAIGYFEDDPNRLASAIRYLQRPLKENHA